MLKLNQTDHFNYLTNRPLNQLDADKAALTALCQAAINVELFTIPLYMCTMYSLEGKHQITGKGNDFYKNRLWPGLNARAIPVNANQHSFNLIFSVFIEEMLHLQMAANIANAAGVEPDFTSPALQSADYGWTCYGPDKSVIPHIIDLKDTKDASDIKVNLGPLDEKQLALFLAIEETEEHARARIKEDKKASYFPAVPFTNWTAQNTEMDLPMFGTIGWMYKCMAEYMNISYSDGENLWQKVFKANSLQRDLFNNGGTGVDPKKPSPGHPMPEYPGLNTTVTATEAMEAMAQVFNMINGITDQGEGAKVAPSRPAGLLGDVSPANQAKKANLELDYPSYNDKGEQEKLSADAGARGDANPLDHYGRFMKIKQHYLSDVSTWVQWHQQGNQWTAKELTTDAYVKADNQYGIPEPEQVADALNNLKAGGDQNTFNLISAGAIAGVTTVLKDYWTIESAGFPFPSMSGAGDRMSINWAIFGVTPSLAEGPGAPNQDQLYHSCQGLDLDKAGASCAAVAVFHTCRGSNGCRAQGGCGFVQPSTGGGSCSAMLKRQVAATTAATEYYSAPGDNKCKAFGGCAVPISASQLLPSSGEMLLFDFAPVDHHSIPMDEKQPFAKGQLVHDIAWDAYVKVMQQRKKDPGTKPQPSDLRLAFPPST